MNTPDDTNTIPPSTSPESSPISELNESTVANSPSGGGAIVGGPLNLEQIRRMREMQAAAQEKRQTRRRDRDESEPTKSVVQERADSNDRSVVSTATNEEATTETSRSTHTDEVRASMPMATPSVASTVSQDDRSKNQSRPDRSRRRGKKESDDDSYTAQAIQILPKVAKPSVRQPLSADLEQELESALLDADLNGLMIGEPSLAVGRNIEEGSRQQGRVIKIHQDSVFISLGGPDEGVVPLLHFTDMPNVDDLIDCLVRSFNSEDGLYELALPGEATSVDDWSDIQEGIVVEATVESSNTGGLECKVGGVRGFIPMRQISEFRVEDVSGYIGKRLMCVVLEANPSRGNLVLSHRSILERERSEKRAERLANLEVGQATEGIVRKIMDFGAFVDIGGLDGLLHISQLSYERVKHPSEILKEGDKIQVRVEKIDPETGKIGLSYRSLQEHPWTNIESQFPIGTMVKGPITRIANFGAFVKLATGVEGLIHVSELAHRRITNVSSVVQEGQEVEVKVLSVDRESQRIGLSLKAALPIPESEPVASSVESAEPDEPPRAHAVRKHQGPLKGGAGASPIGGERFGLKW